jgi:2-dehydro-3-deoxyphosphooctonate aldolase (KDO 8-P synthase)
MKITVGTIAVDTDRLPMIIAGPCVIENESVVFETAHRLKDITSELGFPLVFKSSFDKANRTSVSSFRGPGLEKGLKMLADVRSRYGLPVISDIHAVDQVAPAAAVLDMLQLPAFLCRQTDLIVAAGQTGKPVNIKKGQFLAPWDVKNIIDKFYSTGNKNLLLTERGTSFGYNNLIVDFRAFPIMRSFGVPVVFDVTHSLQLPGGQGHCSGGQREFAAPLLKAAVAAGVDGIFMEVHPDPDRALCDGPNMIALDHIRSLLEAVAALHTCSRRFSTHG